MKTATGRKKRQKEDKQDEKGKHCQNICISGLNIIETAVYHFHVFKGFMG